MQNKRIEVSIIIVNYRVEKELIACISSILKSKSKVSIEIIVVDNDRKSNLKTKLIEKFKQVRYIKSQRNLGYGGGNNLGAKYALGNYLFFLNPDTLILDNKIDKLIKFIESNSSIGIVAPLLLNNRGIAYPQGNKNLGVKEGIIALSFINKIFPKNKISEKYFLSNWNKSSLKEVDVVPGTAFIIKKTLFEQVKGFDEKFFLFFEEFDLCKRIKKLGYKLYINPILKITHNWGASTKKSDLNIKNIFKKSRFYYFKKHYGLVSAFLVELFAFIGKINLLVILIFTIGAFLRLYNIENFMPFIGDQGWFYLSAKGMVLDGQIPLVGISSSHPWLHQGPLWTYMLAGIFWLFGFNPLNGAYLTITLGILSILVVYIVGSEMFSRRVGLMSAILYATSPLVVIASRTPYHTSPIPLFTLLFIFSLYKFIKGNSNFFPLSILFLSILYNLELSTAILWFILFIVLIYGVWKKTEWVKKIISQKILIYSILAFVIPMIPILIYDFYNNFPQTIKFVIWIGYRILKFFGLASIHGESESISLNSMITFSFHFYQYLIFAASSIIAFVILVLSFGALFINIYHQFKKKIYQIGFILLFLWILISFIGYFVNKTSSEAYLPIFFPGIIYLVAFSFDKVMKIKMFLIPVVFLVIMISLANSYFIISKEYFTDNRLNFTKRLSVAKEIIKKSKGADYNLVGIGNGSQFESFTMNYEYLTWWLGHSPTKSPQKLKYAIYENEKGVFLSENE